MVRDLFYILDLPCKRYKGSPYPWLCKLYIYIEGKRQELPLFLLFLKFIVTGLFIEAMILKSLGQDSQSVNDHKIFWPLALFHSVMWATCDLVLALFREDLSNSGENEGSFFPTAMAALFVSWIFSLQLHVPHCFYCAFVCETHLVSELLKMNMYLNYISPLSCSLLWAIPVLDTSPRQKCLLKLYQPVCLN